MRIDIVTLFPSMFDGFVGESIIKRAIDNGLVEVNIVNLRDYTKDKHKKVDDTPYGGGNGMVLACQPVFDCIKDLRNDDSLVIMMTPQGEVFNQRKSNELALKKHLIFICGHYEGFDERIRSIVDIEISIGDFVLTGGELASMVISDSIIRLLDGVIANDSHEYDSHQNWLLEHPHYTKPREYEGMLVPDVLVNGNHKEIEKWRQKESLRRTMLRRPDLLEKKELSKEEIKLLNEIEEESKWGDF